MILSTNEANRRKLLQMETQRAELTQQIDELQTAVKERDELKVQLARRTEERDQSQGQLMQFSKELQTLAGRAEAAASRSFGNTLNAIPASRQAP